MDEGIGGGEGALRDWKEEEEKGNEIVQANLTD